MTSYPSALKREHFISIPHQKIREYHPHPLPPYPPKRPRIPPPPPAPPAAAIRYIRNIFHREHSPYRQYFHAQLMPTTISTRRTTAPTAIITSIVLESPCFVSSDFLLGRAKSKGKTYSGGRKQDSALRRKLWTFYKLS